MRNFTSTLRDGSPLAVLFFIFALGDDSGCERKAEEPKAIYKAESAAENEGLQIWYEQDNASGIFLIHDRESGENYLIVNADHQSGEQQDFYNEMTNDFYTFYKIDDALLSPVGKDKLAQKLAQSDDVEVGERFVRLQDETAEIVAHDPIRNKVAALTVFMDTPLILDLTTAHYKKRQLSQYGFVRQVPSEPAL